MSGRVLHQMLAGAAPGDAITDQALAIRHWLRGSGYRSDLFGESIHPALEGEVAHFSRLGPADCGDRLIFHYSIGSATIDHALALPARLLTIYHNVTPPHFVAGLDPRLAAQLEEGRRRLGEMLPATDLALGDSAYNESELIAAGFPRTGVLPIVLDETRLQVPPDQAVLERYGDGKVNLLCAGRLAPNKRPEDAIKVLYYCRAGGLDARLLLVGSDWLAAYRQWLGDLADALGLGEHVVFTGHVSQAQYNACFRVATVYLTLSEHEGFCKPLIEAMHFRVPIVAYASPAVAETLGPAGVLVRRKEFAAIAELVALVAGDTGLRARLVATGVGRAGGFSYNRVMDTLRSYLAELDQS